MFDDDRPEGNSEAANSIENFEAEVRQSQRYTATQYNHKLDDLIAAGIEPAHSPDWRTDGNTAITDQVVRIAKSFLESLPEHYQSPDIGPEPDGCIMLEWYSNERRLLNVSISETGLIHWAALIGNDDPRGSAYFTNQTPDLIEFLLGRIIR